MILDIIVIGLFILIVFIGVRKGAARMIIGLLMTFVSFIAASWLAKWLSGVIYNAAFAGAIKSSVAESVKSTGELALDLPWWAESALHLSGKEISRGVSDSSEQIAQTVNGIIQPIVVGFMSIIMTLLLFLVLNFILHKLLLKPLVSVFRLPFINAVDRVVGGVIGAVEALLVICMLAYILKLVLPYIDTDVSFLNETTIYNSFIFYHFYSGNIFAMLTSWI